MIQLTNDRFEKFYLNMNLVEIIVPAQYKGGCEIRLTTGRWVSCIESAEEVSLMVQKRRTTN